MAVIWAIALAKLVFHIYFNNRYGYFRDEFDYCHAAITCSGDTSTSRRLSPS